MVLNNSTIISDSEWDYFDIYYTWLSNYGE